MSICSRLFSSVAIMAILATSALAAHADTIDFTYTGTSAIDGVTGTGSGTGSFTYAGTPSSLTLASLTAFSFTDTLTFSGVGSSTYTYSLADLTSFGATLSGDTLLTLVLGTNGTQGSNFPTFDPESFSVLSLGATGASSMGDSITTTIGQVNESGSISATPEPSSLVLLGTGIFGLAGMARRRYLTA